MARVREAASTRAHPEGLGHMRVRERLAFLSEAGEQVAGSLDHLQMSRALAGMLVPRFADFAELQLLEEVVQEFVLSLGEPGDMTTVRRVVVVHDEEPGRWDGMVPEGETLVLPPGSLFVEAMKGRQSVHLPQITRAAAEQISAQFTDRDMQPLLCDRSLLIVPLVARGRVFGTIVLMRRAERSAFDGPDLDMVEELARRAAMSIDNGRLYRREIRVARQLQRSMLPTDPPQIPGARVCYRYLPASEAAKVGGDWFDAIPLPGCRLGIVMGDVMGHGLASATIMGQLRTAVRMLAAQDLRPDHLLRRLDDLSRRFGEEYIATCLYLVYDPVARRCALANAGHLPPVLVSPDGRSAMVDVPSGIPIGVGDGPFEITEFEVEDGSRLVLCTDGLVERRDRDLDQGFAALRAELNGVLDSLDATCDAVLEALTPEVRLDDIALLAVGLDGIPDQDVAVWDLPAESCMVPETRAMVRERLRKWELTEISDTVELLVSELVTNALVHGAGEIALRLIRTSTLLCEVSDDGSELPHLCSADDNAESGRGLQLVSFLAERWGNNRTETGKVVWFEHFLPG
jgi:anti-sigma regulatory factor (Ser/Thr protein kinase)